MSMSATTVAAVPMISTTITEAGAYPTTIPGSPSRSVSLPTGSDILSPSPSSADAVVPSPMTTSTISIAGVTGTPTMSSPIVPIATTTKPSDAASVVESQSTMLVAMADLLLRWLLAPKCSNPLLITQGMTFFVSSFYDAIPARLPLDAFLMYVGA
ncbi:hypothetical protein BC939DRAFT_494755 [Gamsiella multidivaricata]|uniref:uncharacterized protein n=1 Tax=Gamsiella multidivaricata TaxID=101098 RepID=UPI002220A746|nr:uncharacterized protein BC939DRAFT_494755 [Gamsiella multidivaricata]KAI7820111.1 hypothetical protein BC939DRAFT_494755 [Gamsiella multidivaricata]